MNILSVTNHYRKESCKRPVKTFGIALIAVFLSACGVGNDGTETDPVVADNAVAFVKRPLEVDPVTGVLVSNDLSEPQTFRPGAVLYLKDRASPSAATRDISSAAFPGAIFLDANGDLLYDVKDIDVSYDGKKLLFALRAPDMENVDDEDQPTWNIWEYDVELSLLRRLIADDNEAHEGQDVAPVYLADGRIVFSSTRQQTSQAILLDEGKGQYAAQDEDRNGDAFVLHTMDADGDNIQQITFNQSHDLDPIVLSNGKIVFSRWDNAGQTGNNGANLYQVNPDGSGLTYLYGRHSHDSGNPGDTVQFLKPRELDTGGIAVQLREFDAAILSAQPTNVNLSAYVEHDVALDGSAGQGQSTIVNGIGSGAGPNLLGSYGSFFPLYDGTDRYLVSWSVCSIVLIGQTTPVEACTAAKIASGLYESAIPSYGLWILDAAAGTQLPIEAPEAGSQFDDAVIMTSRSLPNFIAAPTLSNEAQSLANEGFGIIHIRSVYDFDGVDTTPTGIPAMADPVQTAVANRPARFIRFEKPVSLPSDDVYDFDNTAFGRSRAQLMREIIGYAPIEPDGSVRVAVPANIALAMSVLDENGQRITERHQNWLHVVPGETVECIGCHTGNSEVPHGRVDAQPAAANTGAVTTGIPFPNTESALFADIGETMAETFTRINGVRKLTADIVYDDEWTDDTVTPKAVSFDYSYADLQTTLPISAPCQASWINTCRIEINYEEHIHPLWDLDRTIFDTDGVTVLDDQTCTLCHSNQDAAQADMIPAMQLDLSDGPGTQDNTDGTINSVPEHFKSYRELFFNDAEQELDAGGNLVNLLVDTGTFETDPITGDLILDGAGFPIPIFVIQNVSPSMNTNGARNSATFMNRFQAGQSHFGYLSGAEMKLISEWLDLGGQYYNNPFDAPEN